MNPARHLGCDFSQDQDFEIHNSAMTLTLAILKFQMYSNVSSVSTKAFPLHKRVCCIYRNWLRFDPLVSH